ncbi:MAG: hypothetical protein D6715_00665 [Calditrichaeota bacterium]|nr:MAG: hypothetical protein D6715_00665 [Calditrichota bacterium]
MKSFRSTAMLVVICLFGAVHAGDAPEIPGKETLLYRQKVKSELAKAVQAEAAGSQSVPGSKSIARAVLFSAAVPGTGQLYAGAYLKAGFFLLTEIAGWAVNIHYNNLGNDKDREFRQFADEKWSEYRYWSYINYRNSQLANPKIPVYPYREVKSPFNKTWFLIDENVFGPDVVDQLRQIENDFPHFTHILPRTKTQQYYEMIGKYPEQFGNAWEDADFNEFYSGFEKRVTPYNQTYTDMRNASNHFFDIAGYGSMALLINHVISAIDAGFSTRSYNRRLLQMTYRNQYYRGELVNMLGLAINL